MWAVGIRQSAVDGGRLAIGVGGTMNRLRRRSGGILSFVRTPLEFAKTEVAAREKTLRGKGRNGKDATIGTIKRCLGDYAIVSVDGRRAAMGRAS